MGGDSVENARTEASETEQIVAEKQHQAEEKGYTYENLPSARHFRLLRLLGKKEHGNSIRCRLVIFEIDSPHRPSYRAVSYTWDNAAPYRKVLCDDRKLEVRNNLKTLLAYVRDDLYDCWLWIDAICIDQTSLSERGHQVKLMGEIYSRANNVLAWLGSGDREIQLALRFIAEANSAESSWDFNTWPDWFEELEIAKEDAAQRRASGWEWFSKFSRLRFWTRRWIIQEIVLARSVVLQAGKRKLAMTEIEQFLEKRLANASEEIGMLGKSDLDELLIEKTPVALLAQHRHGLRFSFDGEIVAPTLAHLLLRYRESNCTEPSDNAYALINLIGEHRRFLKVDYSQTATDRFRTVFSFIQEYEPLQPLEILSVAYLLYQQLGLTGEDNLRQMRQPESYFRTASIEFCAVDAGEAMLAQESAVILHLRAIVPAQRAMPKWSFLKTNRLWKYEPNDSPCQVKLFPGADIVSPHDLSCFSIIGTQYIGLATTDIQGGDRIWCFQHMNLAFVVRVLKDQTRGLRCDIIGRALVVRSTKDIIKSREYGPRLSAMREIFSESEDSSVQEPILFSVPSPDSNLISLTLLELFELAFWADSTGLETSPFHIDVNSSR
jgi:hypothetical protein